MKILETKNKWLKDDEENYGKEPLKTMLGTIEGYTQRT